MAEQFADAGTDRLYRALIDAIFEKTQVDFRGGRLESRTSEHKSSIIPPERVR